MKKVRKVEGEKVKKNERVVIIGSSVAGISAIETIREQDKKIPITVITKEKEVSYSKPLISYQNITNEQKYYRDKTFYRKNNINLIIGEAVLIKNNSVVLKNGKGVNYSKLLLAVGGSPIIPDIKGIDGKNVFTLTNLDDVNRIKHFSRNKNPRRSRRGIFDTPCENIHIASSSPQAVRHSLSCNKKTGVVIGCGMIGIKASEFLKSLGLNVTIVELMDRPFASVLDERAGKMVGDEIKKHTKLILNKNVVRIEKNYAVLKSGEKIPSDVVVCAIGVIPNIEIAKRSKIKTGRGIVVDPFMKTSKKNVYAAGDCVEAFDILKNKNKPLPIWPIAHIQGSIAGKNIVGIKTKYEGGFVMNSVDVFGLPLITLGLSNENIGEEIVSIDERIKKYKKIIIKDGKIIGAILLGDIGRAGIITGLIRDKIDISNFKNEIFAEKFGYIYVPKEFRSKEVIPTEI